MINYEKLSLRLDEALAKETSESLNQWLASEEIEEMENYIGKGIFIHSFCGVPMKIRFQRDGKFCILHFETENEQDLRELLCTIPNVRGCHAILIPSPSKVVASITLKADYAGAWTLTNEKR